MTNLMKIFRLVVLVGTLAFGVGLIGGQAAAQGGAIRIEAPWARASIGTKRPAAAYLTLVNPGTANRLVGVESPIAAQASVHRTVKKAGMMSMVRAGPIDLPAGGRVELKPGGLHIMLTGLRKPLIEGERFTLILHFARGVSRRVTVPIASPGARKPPR